MMGELVNSFATVECKWALVTTDRHTFLKIGVNIGNEIEAQGLR